MRRNRILPALTIASLLMPGTVRGEDTKKGIPSDVVSIPPIGWTIEGTYRLNGKEELTVRKLNADIFELNSTQGWEGVGMLDGKIYRGVFRVRDAARMGVHTIDWRALDAPVVYATWIDGKTASDPERWVRQSSSSSSPQERPSPRTPVDPDHPAFGDYVYVEELPEAITKVPPVYSDVARAAGIDGQVVVQALVLKDGTVGEARVVKSIPLLDASAIAAVRQYKFKPAMVKGKPVAVWVAIPIRFGIH